MTKITSASKKILSLILAMLIACSCMAAASALEIPEITLQENDCVFENDEYGKRIKVKNRGIVYEDTSYPITYQAYESNSGDRLDATQTSDGNYTIFTLPLNVSNVTYIISGFAKINDAAFQVVKNYKITIKNSQAAPSAPVPTAITSTSITLKTVSGAEYKLGNGAWQKSAAFTRLTPDTQYTVYVRYAETETAYASSAVSAAITTYKVASTKPAQQPKLIDKTKNSITVGVLGSDGKVDPNYEYSKDEGKTWQKSGVFTGLTANTMYSFIAREIFDASAQDPNPAGDPIRVVTNEKDAYVASIDKATFKITSQPHDDGIYAGDTVGFKVTGDTRANVNDRQYGDTRFVPAEFKATQDKINLTPISNGTGTITTTGKATVTVTVSFDKEKYTGTEENGGWVKIGSETRTFTFTVKEEYNGVKKFFEKFLNIVLDTIPGIIAKILEMDLLGKLIGLIGGSK